MVTEEQAQAIIVDDEPIVLSATIQEYLDHNGPEKTMCWMLEKLVENISGCQSGDIFSGYYCNHCSKRDVLDKYDDIIIVDKDIFNGVSKLGDYYDSKYIEAAYTNLGFYVISKESLIDITRQVANNEISIKDVNDRLYAEYFSFVKNSLSLAQKVKASMGNIPMQEEEPIDEIEATIRMLLEAEQKRN